MSSRYVNNLCDSEDCVRNNTNLNYTQMLGPGNLVFPAGNLLEFHLWKLKISQIWSTMKHKDTLLAWLVLRYIQIWCTTTSSLQWIWWGSLCWSTTDLRRLKKKEERGWEWRGEGRNLPNSSWTLSSTTLGLYLYSSPCRISGYMLCPW